ncbi:hypothetical protein MTO96_008340 [Rhipicephalus appendiculatus]
MLDSSPPSSSSDLNSSTDSGVVRSLERSPSVPVQMVMPVPRQETPPYKRIRALRLFGSPQTPKTLLQRAEAPQYRSRQPSATQPAGQACTDGRGVGQRQPVLAYADYAATRTATQATAKVLQRAQGLYGE